MIKVKIKTEGIEGKWNGRYYKSYKGNDFVRVYIDNKEIHCRKEDIEYARKNKDIEYEHMKKFYFTNKFKVIRAIEDENFKYEKDNLFTIYWNAEVYSLANIETRYLEEDWDWTDKFKSIDFDKNDVVFINSNQQDSFYLLIKNESIKKVLDKINAEKKKNGIKGEETELTLYIPFLNR